jgi:hypothetical protein
LIVKAEDKLDHLGSMPVETQSSSYRFSGDEEFIKMEF